MKVCGLWYGGSSYATPDPTRDLEQFDSLAAAIRVFDSRLSDRYYPCVEQSETEMHVYIGTDYHENGPDRIIHCGSRGGLIVERA
jgi:hypothetical protein